MLFFLTHIFCSGFQHKLCKQHHPHLLERLRAKAARPPVQTAHHSKPKVYMPEEMDQTTHVWVKNPKPLPLGAKFDGPYRIVERLGTSCLKVRVGSYTNGEPRHDTVHWHNCKPAHFLDEPTEAERPKLGRKPKAKKPKPTSSSTRPKLA